jgi:hypothetical protein
MIAAGQSENYVHSVTRDFSLFCELANDIYVFAYVNGKDVQVNLFPNKKGKERLRIWRGIGQRAWGTFQLAADSGQPFQLGTPSASSGQVGTRQKSLGSLGFAVMRLRRHYAALSFVVRGRGLGSV